MNEPQDREKTTDLVSITEAALRLGVSERTVYRMMRSGKLKRVNVSDKNGRSVRLEVSFEEHRGSNVALNMSDKTDKVTDDRRVELVETIREKDAQIAQLLEQQRELQQNMQRLQE